MSNGRQRDLTTREKAALQAIYGDGDYRMVTTKNCVKERMRRMKAG
jgi:hypothetical protein